MPLGSILAQLKPPGSEILVNCPALEAAGISANAAGKFRAEKLPLDEALRQLLEPLDLSWRAVGPNALQITSQKALAARMEVEFYPAGKLLGGKSPDLLIERIKSALPNAAWSPAAGGGAICFDPLSHCLIVLQSQPAQRAIEDLLAEKAK